ncbi:putative pentatricopeptide repeat-containing protein [Platanthera zijinensis]|uniref:Pentatricopeptide repeat-containing protein n=1 Tax=Platanthera zijinensis TaxID=2320716 RepID=A0AAP0G1A1_9ASPA
MNLYCKLAECQKELNLFEEMTKRDYVSEKMGIFVGASSSMDSVGKLFDEMTEREVVSWNTVIGGNVENGLYEEALAMVKQMTSAGLRPDSFTLSTVLPIFAEVVNAKKG